MRSADCGWVDVMEVFLAARRPAPEPLHPSGSRAAPAARERRMSRRLVTVVRREGAGADSGRLFRGRRHGLHLDLDVDVLADENATRLEHLIPG